jgi:septal ring factor EnvC (AmiA/AmiB activator)
VSFLDKVKQAAEKAAEGAKKGTAQVKEKIELGQLRKKADEDAKQLGYLMVREREGTPSGPEADRLVLEIQALEAQIREASEEAEAAEGAEPPPATEATVVPNEAAPPGPGPAPAPPLSPPPTQPSEPAPGA